MSSKEDTRIALIQSFRKKNRDLNSDSAKLARKDFRSLIQESLNNLVYAGNMAIDQRLPECLSLFSKEITKTDNGIPFRPQLRSLVQSCLIDDSKALEWLDYFDRNEKNVDPYLKRFLKPLLKVLVGEQQLKDQIADHYNR
jgi:hypothetical protein